MPLSADAYIAGLVFFAATVGLIVAASLAVRRRWIDEVSGAPGLVALAVLATSGVLAAHLLPGALGVLSRGSVATTAALIAGAAFFLARFAPRTAVPGAEVSDSPEAVSPLERLVCFGALALVAAFVIGTIVDRGASPPTNSDALGFHLPGVARWIQDSSIWGIHNFLPGVPTAEYPQNGDLLMLSSILPWDNEAFVRLVNYPFLALLGLAVYATGRELGASRVAGAMAAALLLVVPAVNEPVTFNLLTDAPTLALLAAGILFLCRHARTQAGTDLLLAGAALGISLGTKWYGVSAVVSVLGVWAVFRLLSTRSLRSVVRSTGPLALSVAATGGFWFLRNLLGTGNPFYPVRFEPLGVSVLSAPPVAVDQLGFTIAHYLGSPRVLVEDVAPGLASQWGAPALLLLLAVPASLLLLRRRNASTTERHRVLFLASAAVLLLFVYAITPGTAYGPEGEPALVAANARYGTTALVAAAPLLAWSLGRLGSTRLLVELTCLGGVVGGLASSWQGLSIAAFALAVLLVSVAWVATRAGERRGWLERPFGGLRFVVAGTLLAASLSLAGYAGQERYNDGRYANLGPVFDPFVRSAERDLNVAIAGSWSANGPTPTYPPFGPRLENRVEYAGRDDDGTLRAYADGHAFVRRLRAGGYDYVIVGLGIPPGSDVEALGWARAAGFREVARSERLVLLAAPSLDSSDGLTP